MSYFSQAVMSYFLDNGEEEIMGIAMNEKAVNRHEVLVLVEAGAIKQKEGARRLKVTGRQMRRIVRRFRLEGVAGLLSKRSGKRPGNVISGLIREQVLELAKTRYQGFGPTLLAEKLIEEQGIALSVESVRQIMTKGGQWSAERSTKIKRHPLRERRPQFGELIQMDGSAHDWFEGRSPKCTLLVFIDDATGRLTQLRFTPTETTLGYMRCLYDHIVAYGLPMAFYSDRHSGFRVNGEREGQTQWERAMNTLGIEQIYANSPQAKGRVERVNQTLQDRLIKEMRLLNISDVDAANAWLPKYIQEFNSKFAVDAANPEDAHVRWMKELGGIREIVSQQSTRTLSKELTVSYEGRCLQVLCADSGRGLRKAQVTMHDHFDGILEIRREGRIFAYRELAKSKRQNKVLGAKEINSHLDGLRVARSITKLPAAATRPNGARREGAQLQAAG